MEEKNAQANLTSFENESRENQSVQNESREVIYINSELAMVRRELELGAVQPNQAACGN